MTLLLPKLPAQTARDLLDAIRREFSEHGKVTVDQDYLHTSAKFSALGGIPVRQRELERWRQIVLNLRRESDLSNRAGAAEFDRQLALLLSRELSDVPVAQTADSRTWEFLALRLLPDIVIERFPPSSQGELTSERFLAGRRNYLYTAFQRARILGEILEDPGHSLTDDDMVQLVDRSLSNDHRLARSIAHLIRRIRNSDSSNARVQIRNGFKSVLFETRVTALPALEDDEMQTVLEQAFNVTSSAPLPAPTVVNVRTSPIELADFENSVAMLGIDIGDAIEYEAPSAQHLDDLFDAVIKHACKGDDLVIATQIVQRMRRLLDLWSELSDVQQRILAATMAYFILEDDLRPDFGPDGFSDDLDVLRIAESLLLA